MAYVTRSMEGVRQVTPLSSRLLRESERFDGAAKSATQMEAAKEAIFEVKSGTSNPTKRATEAAAERAIMAGQKMAIQGDFNTADVVSPLRQEFFDSMSGMPQFQQAAILDKYSDEFRQQRILNQQEQKSYLQLQEAQRKARFTQAADALQVPVSRRIEEIMSSGDNNKNKFNNLQQSLFENPEALGNPLVASLYDTAFKSVGDKLDAKQKRKNMQRMQEANMLSQAISAGNTGVINSLRKGKGGKGVYDNALKLAESKKLSELATNQSKQNNSLLSALKSADIDTFNRMAPSLTGLTKLQQLELDIMNMSKVREQQGIASDRKLDALSTFVSQASKLKQAADDYESSDDQLEFLIQMMARAGINDEDFAELLGDDLMKLEDVRDLDELTTLLKAAMGKLQLEGAEVDKVAQKMGELQTLIRT